MSLRSALATPETRRQHVRGLFHTIADRYDLITVLLSFGRDRAWKRRLIDEAVIAPGDRGLDLACGTGDITFAAADRGAQMIGLDVTHRMIELAVRKKAGVENRPASARERTGELRRGLAEAAVGGREGGESGVGGALPAFATGDMMALPFPSSSFDLVTVGYGLRNVPELGPAIDEVARVLRPGGRLLSLDFNKPTNSVVRAVYLAYLTVVGSSLGWVLHGDPDTYRYIPESIRRYPGARAVADMLSAHGFASVRIIPLLGGLMTLHVAQRRANSV